MGGAESKPGLSEESGQSFDFCCTKKRRDGEGGVERRRVPEKRTGSFKLSDRKSGSFRSSDGSEDKVAASSPRSQPMQRKSSSNLFDISSWQDSGIWNFQGGDSPKGEKESQKSCNWSSKDQKALEKAIELAAGQMKIKPPGFFAIQVRFSVGLRKGLR
jgi:hypothetical protein